METRPCLTKFFVEISSIIFVFMLVLESDCYQEFMVIQKCELLR